MLLRLFGVMAIFFTASYSSAFTFRCSSAQSYSDQCPASAARISERYRSVSGVCGNGAAVTYSTSSSRACMGKQQLAMLLNRQCEMSRQCGERRPLVPPINDPAPKPISEPIPMPKPIPDTLPPVQPIERPVIPNEPPPPPKPLPPTLPPAPVDPPQSLPGASLPPPSPTSESVSSNFKGYYSSAVEAANLVTVTWSSSELVTNYCGTGTQYSRIAILDKNDSRNAVFFASYPSASRQYMSVTLVCPKPAVQSSPIAIQNEMSDGNANLITVNYSAAATHCYVSAFTAAASPPHCMIP